MSFRKLRIIVWKNLLLRKRQYIITSFEIVLPVITALILVLISYPRFKHDYNTKPVTILEKELRSKCEAWCQVSASGNVTASNFTVYMPETPETTRVVEQVVDELCRNTNGTIGLLPVANASELEEMCNVSSNCRAAIVFPDELRALKTSPADKGATINYEIRMKKFTKSKLLPRQTTSNCYWKFEEDFTTLGPNNDHIKDYFSYLRLGFLGLQIATEKVLAKMLTGEANWNNTISLRNFPHPPYLDFGGGWKQENFFKFTIAFGFLMIFMIPTIVRNVVGEKQSGMTELLRSAGVSNWIQSIGWLIHATGPHLITVSLIVILFCAIKQDYGTSVLGYSDATLVWVALYLSVVYAAAFFYFICSLFQKTVAASITAITLWLLSAVLTFFVFVLGGNLLSGKTELFVCIFPVVAYILAMRIIFEFDQTVVDDSEKPLGAHWNRINDGCSRNGPLIGDKQGATLLEIMTVQLFFTILYMVLAMYFECILPSKYGVKRPWNLSDCKKSNTQPHVPAQSAPYMMANKAYPDGKIQGTVVDEQSEGPKSKASMKSKVEPQTTPEIDGATIVTETSKKPVAMSNVTVGIDIQNVGKSFGDKVAVNGVSLQMYSGDIFALLGHNGAGKTTLISMITGWFSPSYGTVLIDGMDIRDDLDKARNSMGLCPQHNLMFDHLTVSEHLCFFGMLRGQKMKEAKAEANSLLVRMSFIAKAKTAARKLSGGQKRKLCLGMALIGGTKVVILDEPTSGMDPQARREIWDILLELRGERTILLTTHFMEEADVLADRIGIMVGGALQCIGTPAFLKEFYGKGYLLKITLGGGGGAEGDKGSTAPSSKPSKADPPPDSGMVVEPEPEAQMQQLSKEEIKEAVDAILATVKKHIEDAALNDNVRSVQEVILMLPSETATTKTLGTMFSDLTANRAKLKIKTMGLSQSSMEDVFLKVGELIEVDQQKHTEMGTGDGAGGTQIENEETVNSPKVQSRFQLATSRFSALLIKRCIHFIRKWGLLIFQLKNHDYVKTVIGKSGQYYGHVVNDLLVLAERDIKDYKRRYVVALDVNRESNPPEIVAMYNTYQYHSAPLAINLANNIILKYLDPTATRTIRLTSLPLGGGCDDDDDSPSAESRQSRYSSTGKYNSLSRANALMSFLVPLALLLIVTCFIVVPIEERMCQSKQLQTMSGATPALYWGSFFTFDFCIVYFLIIILMLIYMLIFEWYRVYTYGAGAAVFLLIVMIYGFAGICFSYLFSLRAGSVAGGFILVMLIHVISAFALAFTSQEAGVRGIALFVLIIARLFPTYSLTRALIRFGYIAARNSNCRLLNKCKTGHTSYLTWTMKSSLLQTTNDDLDPVYLPEPVDIPGIIQDLVILFFMGVIYAALLLINEYRLWRYLSRNINESNSNSSNDDNVQNEVDRVNNLIANGLTNQDCLLVQNLSKSYGNFAAVKGLTFGVHHGECFGLLGVNGAGKTTAFRMLTGDASPTIGEAYGFNTSLSGDPCRFFSNIGYCPQFDGFIPDFTGREILQLFVGLRGVPVRYRKIEAMNWLKKVGLLESANVRCINYSGGMKRRLTTAMALVGDPALILLDEPTSGVDPVSRRQFWKILDKCRDSGQSVILTSHSMEECEALCSRIAIMVNGEFQCFGGVQHLKNKFAQGYSLILKLKTENFPPNSPELQEKMDSLNEKVTQKFEPCTLKDKHQNLVQYHLENASITWDVLFKALEELKSEFEDFIEDFAVNETSLEEVFLAFARAQYPEKKGNGIASCLVRFFTCRC